MARYTQLNEATLQLSGGLLKTGSIIGLLLNRFHDHPLEKDIKRHGVSTSLVGDEEFTITLKDAVVIFDIVFVVVAVEGQFKLVEAKTCVVLCISFCFFQLADQSVIHRKLLLKKDKQKGTQYDACLGSPKTSYVIIRSHVGSIVRFKSQVNTQIHDVCHL